MAHRKSTPVFCDVSPGLSKKIRDVEKALLNGAKDATSNQIFGLLKARVVFEKALAKFRRQTKQD